MLQIKFKNLIPLMFLFFSLFLHKETIAQCGTCDRMIDSNTPSSYTVNVGESFCVHKDFDFTGTIILNGGTLCNEGTVHNIVFNSGTFNNHGLYSKLTGIVSLNNADPLTINNYNSIELKNLDFGNGSNTTINTYSKMVVNGWIDIHRDSEEDLISLNIYNSPDEKSVANLNVTKDFTVTRGRVLMNVSNNDLKLCTKIECTGFVNIGGQLTVSNSPFTLNVNPNGMLNVKKAVSMDGRSNKELNNSGTINFASDFNIGGNGQNLGRVIIINKLKSTINISKNVNLSYNNGEIQWFINKESNIFVGKSFTQSTIHSLIVNEGKFFVTNDVNIEKGEFINKTGITARSMEIKNAIFTSGGSVQLERDFLLSTSTAIANISGNLSVKRIFKSKGTVNVGVNSFISTKDFINENTGSINGPITLPDLNGNPDSSMYPLIVISRTSTNENSAYLRNYLMIWDQTPPNNGPIYLDNPPANSSRIIGPVLIISPGNSCLVLGKKVILNGNINPNPVCSGSTVTLTATAPSSVLPITVNSYSWAGPSGFVANTATATHNPVNSGISNATVTYTLSVSYTIGEIICVRTRTFSVVVNPNPVIIITGNTSICDGQTTTLTASGANNYVWNTGSTANPFTTPSLTSTTSYTITGTSVSNCSTTNTVVINVNPNPIVNAGVDQSVSQGIIVNLSATVSSGTPPYTYQWTPNGVSMNPQVGNTFDPTVVPDQTTTYTLIVTDANACTGSDEILITVIIDPATAFAHLKKTLDGSFYQVIDNKLKFIFLEEYVTGNLTYKITDSKRVVRVSNTTTPKVYGDNRYEINLTLGGADVGKFFTLEVTSEKNESFFLKFKYQ
ncbi:MAG: hypothetical protein Q8M29_16575 [Bacteroidota bacterium]|nr:hypothetical protein [Bacteroidota bacterium]